ncbi:MAG: hypothetical protein ACJAVV_001001 [Alphaproteobacteria bacterium]|jgi:uncharacterized protein (TIGR03503 family)
MLVCSIFIFSNESDASTSVDKTKMQGQSVDTGVLPIGSEYQNSIKILNNRFRIDGDIKEVTIVFFRAFGSAPIVLVRPDGSKLYLENDLEDDSFNWFETDTYDMISLANPMPGPWQAVGNILPQSRVMVIAGIKLDAEPIPDVVFSGETIKQTARLENIGSKVDISLFKDVVTLSIEFMSTNNPDFSNFGLGSRQIARFDDNGLGFDEYQSDGVFTGQFNLDITEGEWRPIFTVKTPLFSREQINDNIVLRPTPILISHVLQASDQGDHVVSINVDQEFLKPNGVIIDGSVRYPDGEVVKFSMTDAYETDNKLTIVNNEYGIYKVNMTVFASTVNGREVVLSVPEYSFVTAAPEVVQEEIIEVPVETEAISLIEIEPVIEEDNSWLWIALAINFIILIFGSLLILLLVNKRNNPNNHLWLRFVKRVAGLVAKKPNADKIEIAA